MWWCKQQNLTKQYFKKWQDKRRMKLIVSNIASFMFDPSVWSIKMCKNCATFTVIFYAVWKEEILYLQIYLGFFFEGRETSFRTNIEEYEGRIKWGRGGWLGGEGRGGRKTRKKSGVNSHWWQNSVRHLLHNKELYIFVYIYLPIYLPIYLIVYLSIFPSI